MFIEQFYSMVDMISASIWPPFIAGCLIGFPSVCLYSAQLFVILTNWCHFNSSYFVVFALRAGLSLGNFFTSFIAHRIGRVGLGYALMMEYVPSWTLALGTFLMYYSFHLENLTTALLLLNRLTSVIFPMGYEKFWHIFLPLAFAFTILCPLPFTMPVFWLEWVVELDVERTPFAGNNFSFTLNNNVPKDYPLPIHWSYTTICAYSGAAFLVVSLLLNLATLWAFVRTKAPTSVSHQVRGGNSPQNQQQQKMERKLTVYTLITFIGQFIFSLYMILMRSRYFELNHDKQERIYLAIFNQYGWVNDLCTIAIPSWSLIWANKKSRDLIFGKLFNKVCKNVTVATTAVVPMAGGPPPYMNAGGRTNIWQAHWTESSRVGYGRRPTTTVFGHGEHFSRMETT